MKNLLKIILLSILILSNMTSCMNLIEGSGNIVSEERAINGNFDKIRTSGTINIVLTQGTTTKVVVKDADNLLPLLETRLVNGTLVIGYKDNTSLKTTQSEVTITLPQLSDIDMNGTGDLTMKNAFVLDNLKLTMAGTGDVLLQGTAKNMTIHNSGTGKLSALDLVSETTHITTSGTGHNGIHVAKDLTAIVSGTGSVMYKGNPSVKSTITGLGKVIKL